VPQPQQLNWLEPEPHTPGIWDRVDETDRTLVIAALAGLLAKAVVVPRAEEPAND
jgi:hypothetical protein